MDRPPDSFRAPSPGVAPTASPLEGLGAAAAKAAGKGLPPVHLWNPPNCGDIGLRITRDGAWHYRGSPITRPAMVRLFSTILRRDPDGFVLVTPVEIVTIDVEDAPFVAVEMAVVASERGGEVLQFRTNVDDWVDADARHPLRFERSNDDGLKPYVKVRGDLWALVSRALTYDLVARGEVRAIDGASMFGVTSGEEFFVMGRADEIEDRT